MNNERTLALINALLDEKKSGTYEKELLWEEFYEMCIKELRKKVIYKNYTFGPEWDQEDFEQDVMMTVLGKLDKYDPSRTKFTTWLATISSRIYYKRFNKEKVANEWKTNFVYEDAYENSDVEMSNYANHTRSVEDEYFHRCDMEDIQNMIAGLKDNYREVFILCNMEGKKSKEVAKLLGHKVEDIYKWLHRANKKIVEHIVDESLESALFYEYEL